MRVGLIYIILFLSGVAQAAGPQPCFYARGIYAQCFPRNFYTGAPSGTLGTVTHQTATEIADGFYRSGAGAQLASATQTGYTTVTTSRVTASGSTAFEIDTNYQDAQTADSALVVTNGNNALSITGNGQVTAGVGVKFVTTGGTPSNLNYYEEDPSSTSTTFTFNGTGSPGTSSSFTMHIVRVGAMITVRLGTGGGIRATSGTGSTLLTSNTAVPTRFRPAASVLVATQAFNNGADVATPGLAILGTDGIITILRDGAGTAFTNATSCGTDSNLTFTFSNI